MKKVVSYVYSLEAFVDLLTKDSTSYDVNVELDGLIVEDTRNGCILSDKDINEVVSKCLGRTVSSVHVDDCYVPGIWVSLKKDEE